MKDSYPLLIGLIACSSVFIQPDRLFGLSFRTASAAAGYTLSLVLPGGFLAIAYQELPRNMWNSWAEGYIIVGACLQMYSIVLPSQSELSRLFYRSLFSRNIEPENDESTG